MQKPAATRIALTASLNSPISIISSRSQSLLSGPPLAPAALEPQLLMLNILRDILELPGLCSSIHPLLVTKPPMPTAAMS
jgi:hypothetical protein